MSKPKHTPGPWTVHANYPNGLSGVGRSNLGPTGQYGQIANCADVTYPISNEQMEANARLIAAAPELLDATKTFLETVQLLDQTLKPYLADTVIQGSVFDLRTVMANLERLIAKAEGGDT